MAGRPAVAKLCGWSVGGWGRGWSPGDCGAPGPQVPVAAPCRWSSRPGADTAHARSIALLGTPGAAIRSRAAHRLASAAGVLVSGRRGMLRVEMPPSALDPCSTSGGGRGRPRPSRRDRRIPASPRLSRTTPRDERTAVPGAQPRPWSRARHGQVAPAGGRRNRGPGVVSGPRPPAPCDAPRSPCRRCARARPRSGRASRRTCPGRR